MSLSLEKLGGDSGDVNKDSYGSDYVTLFSSLLKGGTMTLDEIMSRSLNYIYAVNHEINRLRYLEAGIDPDGDSSEESASGGDFWDEVNEGW